MLRHLYLAKKPSHSGIIPTDNPQARLNIKADVLKFIVFHCFVFVEQKVIVFAREAEVLRYHATCIYRHLRSN